MTERDDCCDKQLAVSKVYAAKEVSLKPVHIHDNLKIRL